MITAVDISFSYQQTPILTGFSHRFAPGTITGITGVSGKGKSTLLYILGLLLEPRDGRVLIDGTSLTGASDDVRSRARAGHFGFVFQDALLDLSRTVLDNVIEQVIYARGDRHGASKRAMGLLERVGVEVPVNRRPGEISGGQAQRIALCRAMINDPPIYLADEPTGNLDRTSRDAVLSTLRDETDNAKTVIIASHDDAVIAWCDEVISL